MTVKSNGKAYALKEIQKALIRQTGMEKQVINEIKIMYSLHHENIVKLYNHFEDDKSCYLLMEFAAGVSAVSRGPSLQQTHEAAVSPLRREDSRPNGVSTLQGSHVPTLKENHPSRYQT